MSNRAGGGGSSSGNGGNGFKSLNLSEEVFKGIVRMGFRNPTPVQRKALPIVLSGADTIVMARTGSGKTCAFLIPLLETLLSKENTAVGKQGGGVRAVILSPTRELSLQTLRVFKKLAHFTNLRAIGIHGGEGMEQQFNALSSKPDVIIATPGRLAHHLSEIPDFHLKECQICILDEADRLLEMGFAMQLRQISRSLPPQDEGRCQKVLLSATMPKILVEFTKGGFTTDPQVVRLDQEATVSEDLRISFITCRSMEKDAALLQILSTIRDDTEKYKEKHTHDTNDNDNDDNKTKRKGKRKNHNDSSPSSKSSLRTGLTLIFCATRHHVEYVTTLIQASFGGSGGSSTSSTNMDATMIYGSLDNDARNANLSAFRNGKKPILVVTDVAARGIDVPLMDHVIHYHFPPTAKLFVHRSGRAARAGRIGYCWGLVEPDELPYMVDLHLFLGRRLTSSAGVLQTGKESNDQNKRNSIELMDEEEEESSSKNDNNIEANKDKIEPYTLNEMTPDMVHYGCVPESILTLEIENVRRIMDSEMVGSDQAEVMRALTKVCANAMKQYRKTRPEASREGVRRAKGILEGTKLQTGERVGITTIPAHPLLQGIELQQYQEDMKKGKIGMLNNLENIKKRQQFLQAVAAFRPRETVFEAFATGGGKDVGIVSQVDKGRTSSGTLSSKKSDSSFALTAMKNMRRQMRMVRDKGTALVVAGSSTAAELNNDDTTTTTTARTSGRDDDDNDNRDANDNNTDDTEDDIKTKQKSSVIDQLTGITTSSSTKTTPTSATTIVLHDQPTKQRMSRAERKRLKKNNNTGGGSTSPTTVIQQQKRKTKKVVAGTDFRDPTYFIDNEMTSNPEEVQRQRQVEAAMQPSAASSIKGSVGTALRIEEAMLDIVGDENEQLVQKQRMIRWDKSKRKYIQTTVGSELSGESRSKKIRLESGQLIRNDKAKLGELYEKWQKKTNRSVGREGIFDNPTTAGDTASSNGHHAVDFDDANETPGRWKRNNNNTNNGKNKNKNNHTNNRPKTAKEIKMEREKQHDMKLKNMKKEDRKRYERNNNKNGSNDNGNDNKKKYNSNNKNNMSKGFQGKKGTSGRWSSNTKMKGRR